MDETYYDLIIYSDHSLCSSFGDFNRFDVCFLSSLGFLNLVKAPTRIDAFLDLALVNSPNMFRSETSLHWNACSLYFNNSSQGFA